MEIFEEETDCVRSKYIFWATFWNIPGWDRVGIEVTGFRLNPNFLPS